MSDESKQKAQSALENVSVQRAMDTLKENLQKAQPFEMNGQQVKEAVDAFTEDLRKNPSAHRTGMKVLSSEFNPEDQTLYVNVEFTPTRPVENMKLPPIPSMLGGRGLTAVEPKFLDYFTESIEYPRNVAANPIPMNTLWSYISSTFLNGFINYVTIIDAQLLDRYMKMDEYFNNAEDGPNQQYHDGTGWVQPPDNLTKRALFDLYTNPKNRDVPKLNCFDDDVLILSRCRDDGSVDTKGMYMFFWFDQDVSDCGIGRFHTDEPEEVVIEKFRAYANHGLRFGPATTIPLTFFKNGWTSF